MVPGDVTLYFVSGKIAAGKSSLARSLAAEHGAVLLCEDEWLTRLDAKIENFDDFVVESRRLRAALAPHIVQLLKLGLSVVLDFAGNTPRGRAWFRALFEAAGAKHELHYIEAADDICKGRLRIRNATKPEGLYWGYVPESDVDIITGLLVPPSEAEGFNVIRHSAQ